MIKYIGSKRALVDWIGEAIAALDGVRRVADLFSGSARVGRELKRRGYAVWSNDALAFSATLARGLVAADAEEFDGRVEPVLEELRRSTPVAGWFTEDYCERARYFRPENGARIEGMRERLAELELEPGVEAIALSALLLAADKVDSTVGVQMAYLKQWAPRAARPLELVAPDLLPRAAGGPVTVSEDCALEVAPRLDVDCVYLDPPYNQHSYLGNYHVWETLVRWDRPQTYGVANKRVDCRERTSPFNRKREAAQAFERLVGAIECPNIVASFSDEGFLDREFVERVLSARREVVVLARTHERYVGSKIGIHDRAGRRVGRPGPVSNTEFLFVAAAEGVPAALSRSAAGAAPEPS